MKVSLLPAAEVDLLEGFVFYEEQQAGLGDYFLSVVESGVADLSYQGGTHQTVHHIYRVKYTR